VSGRGDLDIFVAAGARHHPRLRSLLPLLRPHGAVHVVSSFLDARQLRDLEPEVDFLHEPRLAPDPYRNFLLFFIREVNGLTRAARFLKIDTDVVLRPDWFDFVREGLEARPECVLFGSHAGSNRIDYRICGPLVRSRLGADVRVRDGLKVNGAFCVADAGFFREHDHTMQVLHDLIFAFEDGRRVRPGHLGTDDLEVGGPDPVRLRGVCARRQGQASYDNLLSLTAHVLGAGDRIFVREASGRIRLPHKRTRPAPLKRAKKWMLSRAGVPWRSTKKAGP
jgi:hypothetical protein